MRGGDVVRLDRHRPPSRVEPPPVAGRPPPHDLEAEAAVLSAVLLDRDALNRVLEILKPEHFYSEANARIYQAAQALAVSMTPIDLVSVASWLRDREWLQKMGGTAYLAQLADATPAVGHVQAHARVVHEKWRLRKLIATCQRVSAEGYGDVGDVQQFIEGAQHDVTELAASKADSVPDVLTSDVADAVIVQVTEALTGRATGTPWGWSPVDARVGHLMPQGYYVVPARSGHGKTQFATQTALNIAEAPPRDEYANVVYLASYEMPCPTLFLRTLCIEAEVPFKKVNAGMISHERSFERDGADCPSCGASYRPATFETLAIYHGQKVCADCHAPVVPGPSEQERLKMAATRLRRTQIVWDDRRCTPAQLGARVRAAQERAESGQLVGRDGQRLPKGKVRAVIVDYIQKIPAPPGPNNRSRQVEVAAISNGLVEDVAKACKVAVIALAQLNRSVDKMKDVRPTLADIREAGDIEQDADEILAIHREQYKLREKTPLEYQNIAELIHLKGRGGLDAELPPARMWFAGGRFHSKPPDEQMCGRHSRELAAAGADPGARNAVFWAAHGCIDCYAASWDAWADRVGVKRQ